MMINVSTSTCSNGSTKSSSNNSRPETEATTAAHNNNNSNNNKGKTILRYVPSTDHGSRSTTPSISNQQPSSSRNNDSDSAAEPGSSTTRSQAAFVNKLYKMLEDPDIQHMISWSESGDLFSVTNPISFSRSVLPQYFKHNNWQSFVRQLNMYGFHKVNDMIHSNLTSEVQNWEFKHPHFRRGAVEDLKNIKRKSAKSRHQYQQRPSSPLYPNDNDEHVYGPMYKHIVDIEDRLHHVHKAYEVLNKETLNLRSIISSQQEIITDLANVILSMCRQDQAPTSQGPQVEKIVQELQRLKNATAAIPAPCGVGGLTMQEAPSSSASSIGRTSPLPSTTYSSLSRQPQRLPSISAVQQGQSHLDNLDAHTLNPPVGYSESVGSSIYSPSDELPDRKPKISLLSIPPGSPPRKMDYATEEKKDARPQTEFLGLGSHSQLLNPAPSNFDERYASDRKQKGVKRNLPHDF